MQKVLFLSRVAFICNICFVITWFMQYAPVNQQGHIASTLVVLGVGIAVFLNVIVNALILFFLLFKKTERYHFPRWLIIANFLFLIAQLIIFLT